MFSQKPKSVIQRGLRAFHQAFFGREPAQRIGIYFHQLEKEEQPLFKDALLAVKAHGYRFVSPADFLTAHGKVAYLSFDDNHQEWVDVLPFFEQESIPATFFINTCVLRGETSAEALQRFHKIICYRGNSEPLSRQEIRMITDAGHTVGCHTHSHPSIASLVDSEITQELTLNRDILEEITQKPVEHMAFTFGMPRFFPPRAERVCRGMGFKTISWATPCMQYAQGNEGRLHRSPWLLHRSPQENFQNLQIDGRLFVKLTGRSPIG